MTHKLYMQRCLMLAKMGEGAVAPNPMVGAVLVYNNVIIGEGYHKAWGGPHAEVHCLNSVAEADKHLIAEATLYVSLEPCAHHGKTPPCADLIIHHQIKNVVVGCRDPFIEVAGKGIEKLKAAGVCVTVGILEDACIALNKRFFIYHTKQRPYITLKWAQTADDKIAARNFNRVQISNQYTNRLVHQWRSQEMSILVGTNTALFDDPALTTRLWPGKNPLRLVIDAGLRLPVSLKLFDGENKTIVFNKIQHSAHFNLQYHRINPETDILQQVLKVVYDLKMHSLMVEGGAQLLQSFIDAGLWDEARVITAEEKTLPGGLPAPALHHHQFNKAERIFSDTIRTFTHQN